MYDSVPDTYVSPVATTFVPTDCAVSTSPAPPSVRRYPLTFAGSAVDTRAAARRTPSAAVRPHGQRAAMPATCGAAMDVPDRYCASVPVPTDAEAIDTLGVLTPGFRPESPLRGLPEENEPNPRCPGSPAGTPRASPAGPRPR